ncbi:MAG: peptidoglycan bridge formation glycyltransferase FemA/FemB family protein [Anaerolineae bacterium]|nr:peptidoglycan bridge formation glycyltransferase FemA/FemB family protein [Anaerolineae bacterium]
MFSVINTCSDACSRDAGVDPWDHFVATYPTGSVLQTRAWGCLKAGFGWGWEIVTLPGQPVIAGALQLYRKLFKGLATIAYVPRGPLVDWSDAGQVAAMLATLERVARRRRALALWIEPPLLDAPEIRAQLQALGFSAESHTVQPPRTILVDIGVSEDEVLAAMKSKTRYNIRLAERKGVTVREAGVEALSTFYGLMLETGDRDAFGIRSEAYYRRTLEVLDTSAGTGGKAALLIAEVDGEAVAALIVCALGNTAWYFYGASSNRHRNAMPTYTLQWAAIRWAKAQGCRVYDLWGIPDADEATLEAQFNERQDGLWGVYRFKRGFGGQVVRYVGLWEKSLSPLYPLVKRRRP